MSDDKRAPRKTLGLPAGKAGPAAGQSRRKPLRGKAPFVRTKAGTDPEKITPEAAKAAEKPKGPARAASPRPLPAPPKAPRRPAGPLAASAPARKASSARPERASRAEEMPRPQTAPAAHPTPRAADPAARAASAKTPSPDKTRHRQTAPSAHPALVRVSKLMAKRGLCSRREADEYIARGWVYVDGVRVLELGTRADPSARIALDKVARARQERRMTILLHKPVGYVSGQPEPGFIPAMALVRAENQRRGADDPVFQPAHLVGLAPAGRLDIDSTGLLVLTQDGRIARQLIGEESTVDKEYLVRVDGALDAEGLARLRHGLVLDGRPLKPATVEWINGEQLRFVLNEGRKRQIRRMCELVGLRVAGLKRVRIGKVMLGELPSGQWRYLREDESFSGA